MTIFKTLTSPVTRQHRKGIDRYLGLWLKVMHSKDSVTFNIWQEEAPEAILHASIAASIVVAAIEIEQGGKPGHIMNVFRREYDRQPDTDAVAKQRSAFVLGDGLITTDQQAWNPATDAGVVHQRAVGMSLAVYGLVDVMHGLEAVMVDMHCVLQSPLTTFDSYDVAVTVGELYFNLISAPPRKDRP